MGLEDFLTMPLETWFAFVAATVVLLIIPGPTVLLVVSYALGQGWRTALPMALGVASADMTAMTLSMLGVGVLLKASAALFGVLKWAGAAYLFWLGAKLWRAGGALQASPREGKASAFKMAAHAWIVTCLNPKGIVFFVAFLPQFVDPGSDFYGQMAILVATFVTLSFINSTSWALAASQARSFVQSERAMSIVNKTGGTLLIGAALATVAVRTA
jgi:threonine/homoserine/homoserine lactone efflux protein